MTAEADARYMALALSLGRRGRGRVWPNPAVGCVIVRGDRIIGRGWTQAGGRPHAEAVALVQAGAAARGATAYITLEPCAHVSPRGPACSQSLIAAGVARVVTAMADPDPRTAGNGHAALRAAGILVDSGVLADAAASDHAGFVSRVQGGPVSVTLKLATTLDGRIATATGESRWITGPAARRDVHALRARHDGVLVGIGTALADDPDMTVRGLGMAHQPVRIVADTRLRLPPDSRLGRTAATVPLWLVHGPAAADDARKAWRATGARLIEVSADAAGHAGAGALIRALGKAGMNAVLCEGGAGLAGALLATGRVDNIVLYQAGRAFGGDGLSALAPMGVTQLLQGAAPFLLRDCVPVGDDLRSRWHRRDLP